MNGVVSCYLGKFHPTVEICILDAGQLAAIPDYGVERFCHIQEYSRTTTISLLDFSASTLDKSILIANTLYSLQTQITRRLNLEIDHTLEKRQGFFEEIFVFQRDFSGFVFADVRNRVWELAVAFDGGILII